MTSRSYILGITLALSGASVIFGSLIMVYLDSIGYWGYPKDFLQALFRDRASEPGGLTIQGLQFFHYLIGGVVLLGLGGGGLLALTRSVAHVPLGEEVAATQNSDELRHRITLLEREKEKLTAELWRRERRPSGKVGYMLLLSGALCIISSILYSSLILAFIGLGLTFWGALLLYIAPTRFVRGVLLGSTATSSLVSISRIISDLNYEGKGIYLPPRHLREVKGGTVFIPSKNELVIPPVGETTGEKVFLKNPNGMCLAPPGLSLVNLYEDELGTDFAKVDLNYLRMNLPKLFIEGLEIAEDLEISVEGVRIHVRITGSIYTESCREIRNTSPNICTSLGCPLCSSITCALARTTGKPVMIEETRQSEDGKTIEAYYRIVK